MYAPITGVGDGSAPVVNLTFDYIDQDHVKATVDGVTVAFTWTAAEQITFDDAVTADAVWEVYRETPISLPLVDFTDASVLTAGDLDLQDQQLRFHQEEVDARLVAGMADAEADKDEAVASAAAAAASATAADASAAVALTALSIPSAAIPAIDRAALALLSTSAPGHLMEDGRAGYFVFDSSPLVAEVAADTEQGVYVAPSSDTTGASGAWVRQFTTLEPEWFGAAGDGVTDDYAAFVALASFVNFVGSGTIRLRANRTYYIAQFKTAANTVNPIDFQTLNGLVFDGNGATISFNGDFDRDLASTTGIGLRFDSVTGLVIRNLEVNGNNELSTNSSDATENNNAVGIRLGAPQGALLENVHVHNFQNDGIMVGIDANNEVSPGVYRSGRNVTFINVVSEYNSRQALTIKEVENMTVIGGSFSYSGQHGGTYGKGGAIGHAPKAGMDFEPTATAFGGDLELNPNNVNFYGTRFIGNSGAAIAAANQDGTRDMRFFGCRVEVPADATPIAGILLGIPGIVIRDSYLNMGPTRIELQGGGGLASHLFENNTVLSDGTQIGIYDGDDASEGIFVRHNRFVGTAAAPVANVMAWLRGPQTVFEDNDIFIPAAGYTDGGGGDGDTIATFNGARRVARNTWRTDLLAASGSGGTAHYFPVYGTAQVIDESYEGTAPGTADTIRPEEGSTHDTTALYPTATAGAAVADPAALTYVAPSGGTTVDAESRSSLAQLAADVTATRSQLIALLTSLENAEVITP